MIIVKKKKAGSAMAVMDEFKEERANLKNQPLKKRLAYFWTYYKWHVLGGLFAALVAIVLIRDMTGQTKDVLYGAFLNAYSTEIEETLADDFAAYLGIDTNKYSVTFNSGLRMSEQFDANAIDTGEFFSVYIAAGDLDVAVMDPYNFRKYAYADTYKDLRDCLDDKMLNFFSDKLFYVDLALLEEVEARSQAHLSTEDLIFPDPSHPEEMTDPIPVGIDISGCSRFTDAYYYQSEQIYLGIIINSDSVDTAVRFLEFLFAE